jgi:hypothetical protein
MKDLGAGRMIFMSGSSMDLVTPIQKLLSWASNSLLLATDIEEGVGQRFVMATDFSPPMEITAITKTNLKKAQEDTETVGELPRFKKKKHHCSFTVDSSNGKVLVTEGKK